MFDQVEQAVDRGIDAGPGGRVDFQQRVDGNAGLRRKRMEAWLILSTWEVIDVECVCR